MPSSIVLEAPMSCRIRGRGRRRSSHFSNPKQLKGHKRRRGKDTSSRIVEVDCSSDDTTNLRFKQLGAICEVPIYMYAPKSCCLFSGFHHYVNTPLNELAMDVNDLYIV